MGHLGLPPNLDPHFIQSPVFPLNTASMLLWSWVCCCDPFWDNLISTIMWLGNSFFASWLPNYQGICLAPQLPGMLDQPNSQTYWDNLEVWNLPRNLTAQSLELRQCYSIMYKCSCICFLYIYTCWTTDFLWFVTMAISLDHYPNLIPVRSPMKLCPSAPCGWWVPSRPGPRLG